VAAADVAHIMSKEKKLQDLRSTIQRTQKELSGLENELNDANLDARVKQLRAEVEPLNQKLARLKSTCGGVDKTEIAKVETLLAERVGAWKKRKRIMREAVGQIGEACGKKDKDIYEATGVETDEDVGISIKPFDDSVHGILKARRALGRARSRPGMLSVMGAVFRLL
jgi:DNA repair exonuclease SbcCD ATPase subunit